jgi:hypothetical protein
VVATNGVLDSCDGKVVGLYHWPAVSRAYSAAQGQRLTVSIQYQDGLSASPAAQVVHSSVALTHAAVASLTFVVFRHTDILSLR